MIKRRGPPLFGMRLLAYAGSCTSMAFYSHIPVIGGRRGGKAPPFSDIMKKTAAKGKHEKEIFDIRYRAADSQPGRLHRGGAG
jgi:hypothetical protein